MSQATAQLRLAEAGREVEMLRAKLTAASSAAAANGKTLVEQRQELKQVGTVPSAVCRAQQIDSELSCVSVRSSKHLGPRQQHHACKEHVAH